MTARATIAGNIHVVDNPEAEGRDAEPYEVKQAIVIQFDDIQELRDALQSGECKFGGLGGPAA